MNVIDWASKKAADAKTNSITALESAKAALAKGFDTKAGQKDAMETLRRATDGIKAAYQEAYFVVAKEATQAQKDFYWDFPDLHVWKQKHVDTANTAHPELAELANLMTELAAMRAELKAAPVVKVPTKAEVKAAKLAEPAKAGNLEILRDSLASVRDDVVAQYAEYAAKIIANIKAKLNEKGWNITEALDYEESRQTAYRIVKVTNRNGDCQADEMMEAAHIESYKKTAQNEFDGFIAKMTLKLGNKSIVSISCTGRIWQRCTVVVKCDDGSTVTMRTQMILNTSKNGKLFNQWPTRITIS